MSSEEGAVTKKEGEGKCNEGRPEDPKESRGTFPPRLSVTHFSFLPPSCPSSLRESRCIIHDFVNVACRCIFTALYLEKFRAGETRYTAASARGVLRTRASCVSFSLKGAMSNPIRYWIGCPTTKSGGAGKNFVVLMVYTKMNYKMYWTQVSLENIKS